MRYFWAAVISAAIFTAGCESKPQAPAAGPGKTEPGETQTKTEPEKKPAVFSLGDMAPKDFNPPATLADLDAKGVQWKANEVLDSYELLKEHLAKEKSALTAADALKLRNSDKESNQKILSALGQLPADVGEVSWDAEINRYQPGDISGTFTLFTSSVSDVDVQDLIGFGLFGFDWTFRKFAVKDAVVSWHSSEDGLYDKVVLRDDLKWSNGEPITAHDVEYTYKLIMTEAVPVKAMRQGTDQLLGVKAYDDRTVVYFHKKSLVTNIDNIYFSIIPKKVYEGRIDKDPKLISAENAKLDDDPVVGGAYRIKSRTRGQETVLERREDYYLVDGKQVRQKPMFKTIRFRVRPDSATALLALKAGDLDEMVLTPELWQNQTDGADFYERNTKVFATEWTNFQFTWNLKEPMFAERDVRLALAYAFDHKELLQTLLFGLCEPCTGNFHPASRWAPVPAPKPISQDLDKAEELLDASGWKDSDGDGVRDKVVNGKKVKFEFTVLCSNAPDRINICNLLKESLQQIGIEVAVKPLEFPALLEKLEKKEFQAAFGGWGTGADPDTSENLFKTGEPRNYGSYSNPEVDKLFEQGKTEFDLEKRQEVYRKIARILWDDQVFCWLYYRNAFYGFNKNVRGYNFSPRGPFHFGPGFGAIYKTAQP